MNKFLAFVFFVLLSFAFLLPVFAQQLELIDEQELAEENQEAETVNSQDLDISFRENIQNPANKNKTFEMVITSKVNSDRVRVTWQVRGVSVAINEEELVQDLVVRTRETYVIPITIRPTGRGVSEVYGTARIVGAEASQVATVRKNYASNSSRDVLPITDEYRNSQILNFVWLIVRIVIFALIIIVGGYVGFKQFVRWYKQDEIKAFETSKRT